jgi:hypothetical protein
MHFNRFNVGADFQRGARRVPERKERCRIEPDRNDTTQRRSKTEMLANATMEQDDKENKVQPITIPKAGDETSCRDQSRTRLSRRRKATCEGPPVLSSEQHDIVILEEAAAEKLGN